MAIYAYFLLTCGNGLFHAPTKAAPQKKIGVNRKKKVKSDLGLLGPTVICFEVGFMVRLRGVTHGGKEEG